MLARNEDESKGTGKTLEAGSGEEMHGGIDEQGLVDSDGVKRDNDAQRLFIHTCFLPPTLRLHPTPRRRVKRLKSTKSRKSRKVRKVGPLCRKVACRAVSQGNFCSLKFDILDHAI